MSALLSVCTKEEQRSVIKILWADVVKGAKIHFSLCAQYGDSALLRRSTREWIVMFKNSPTSVTDAKRSGRPSTATEHEKQEEARVIILADRRVITEEIAVN
jgi:hypothetical protein